VSVVGQWDTIGSELPDSWKRASLRLELVDRAAADRAAAQLGPAGPYRTAPTVLQFSVARDGSALGPEALTRLLRRVGAGTLSLTGSELAPKAAERETTSLVASWDAAIAALPADWSDAYGEIDFTSTDYIEPAAVLCVQMNPRRDGDRAAFRFRTARTAGYGVAPSMARRCLERCDSASIRGSVTILRALSDTELAATQGPVWLLQGQTV
jgi:hypothetical protein